MQYWLGFASVVPKGYNRRQATGMVTYGMRPFLGYELELAPRPASPEDAYHTVAGIALDVLGGRLDLNEGLFLPGIGGAPDLTVRERNFWLRRDHTARVLVADDAVVAVESLHPGTRQVAA